jgi:hypothetical protein
VDRGYQVRAIRKHEEFEVQWYLGISSDLLAAVGAE